jgi:inner membrane protein
MEPVTHFLTGAVLARSGFNRKAAYATLAMTLAAEFPDVDVLWGYAAGPVAGLQHHRGITHTFLGIPFEAAFIVGLIWLIHRWRLKRGKTTAAPIHWPLLWLFSVIALLSHILLDWTNNYGVRPFFPFNPHWYAGSFVFIFEPAIFAALLLALLAPVLFGLINSEVGARKPVFRGRGWAIAALLFIVALWSFRYTQRDRAQQIATDAIQSADAQVLRVAASPYMLNPFEWHVIIETPNYYQLDKVDTNANTAITHNPTDRFYKPAETPATLAAKQSYLGHVYLDWSQYPIVVTSTTTDADHPNQTAVAFHDLRFMFNNALFQGRTHPVLSGTAYVNSKNKVVEMQMDSKPQR